MDLSEFIAIGLPVLAALMVAGCIIHAWFAARKPAPAGRFFRPRVVIACLLHLLFAGAVYWLLNDGGWFTATYNWTDPDNFHLVLAIFEALCVVVVIALVAARKRFFYKLAIDLLIIQFIIAASLLSLFLWFVLTYQPKMF
jgi:hypothetical protein